MSLLLVLMNSLSPGATPPALSVVITPSAIVALGATPLTCTVITGDGNGGSGGYSYAWDWSAGGTGITINTPSTKSTTLTITTGIRSGTLRCTVTDSDVDTAVDTISISMEILT